MSAWGAAARRTELGPHQLAALERVVAVRPDVEGRVADLLRARPWATWCTLYVDSSNAPGRVAGQPALWAWGARARIGDEIAALLGVSPYLAEAAGPSPLAGRTPRSDLAELWGVCYAAQHVLAAWPWLTGVGVRCDNQATVGAVEGCDGRRRTQRGAYDRHVQAARERLTEVLTGAGVLVRATHVRGHGRAGEAPQRAFNHDADRLARRVALEINGQTPREEAVRT